MWPPPFPWSTASASRPPPCLPGCALRGDTLRLPWRAQKWMLLQGLASFALSYVCTYSSEQYLVSALVSVLFALDGVLDAVA